MLSYTAGWAIFQFRKSRAVRKQEKAVEIAKEFSDTIVSDLGILNNVYLKSNLQIFLPRDEKQAVRLKYFNVEEVRRIYKKDEYIDIYKNMRKKCAKQLDDLYHIYLYRAIEPYSYFDKINELENKILLGTVSNYELKKMENKIFKVYGNTVPYHFWELESKVLNKLEYICMNIASKAADSKYIYQSLHQIFLRSIRALYLEIATINIDSADKCYTNIIHVYNEWMRIYLYNKRCELKREKKYSEKLNPKTKTV